ncbi:CHAD domain-containing protein [Cereibacter sphaeroides]|uniref:CHAD domain-containing protein n=1 Tax=Cereibacter sphaeroides TaxID=1063 RepID=UPI001F3F32ED|nr:CHAD domain-containing protein [Cereibacter sphaeroides]MCE6969518.1 CHAD domain-containing protein [Cereibacter sphaeroides]
MARDLTPEAAEETAEAAFRRILSECLDAYDRNLERLMDSDDPEGPHKARVALRRLRSALVAFEALLDPDFTRKVGRRARHLFRILGELRDADVLAGHQSKGPRAAAAARKAERIRTRVRARLRHGKAARFSARLVKALGGKGWRRGGRRARALAEGPAALIGGRALGDCWATCLSHGSDLGRMSDTERHEMRKDLKTLRYTVEFFGPLWPGTEQERFLSRMKDLQDELGHLNDLALLRREGADEGGRASEADEALRNASALWQGLALGPVWWHEGEGRPASA